MTNLNLHTYNINIFLNNQHLPILFAWIFIQLHKYDVKCQIRITSASFSYRAMPVRNTAGQHVFATNWFLKKIEWRQLRHLFF